ncbi:MAG: nicotinamidase-related amidase [Psychromonas sp.]|jgi:nicotinamidase-related amidase|uniref:isochorismatase family protein n=1 Tax=Psychromonas sp. TaxID=1884585 RepID=UPI0039E5ACFF
MLIKENTGLIIIDIQGKLATLVHDSDTFIANCKKLIKGAQTLDLPIIWLEQNPNKMGPTVDQLSILLDTQNPIPKFTFDACAEPQFMQAVRTANVDTWLICGIEAHICVYQTALTLKHTGVDVQLVCDCISSRTLANKNLAISKLVKHGVDVTGLEMCLFELLNDCRAKEFKEILGLIK